MKNVAAKVARSRVFILILGTALGQLIPVLATPLLTRLFSPEDFGVFAMYASMSSLMAVALAGRYELAIVVPASDLDGLAVLTVALLVNLVIGSLLTIVAYFGVNLFELESDFRIALALSPFGAMLLVAYQGGYYWCNRKENYTGLAGLKITLALLVVIGQFTVGYLLSLRTGLILGQLTAFLLVGVGVVIWTFRAEFSLLKQLGQAKIIDIARKYSKFPRYLIAAHGFNTFSAQMPALTFGVLFDPAAAGFYLLAQRIVGAPVAVIATAFGDVFRRDASIEYAKSGECSKVYKTAALRLVLVALIPTFLLIALAPSLVTLLFGERWLISAEYLRILAPMYYLKFVVAPLTGMYMIAQAQRLDLLLNIVLAGVIAIVAGVGFYTSDPVSTLKLFTFSYCVVYGVAGWFTYKLSIGWHPERTLEVG